MLKVVKLIEDMYDMKIYLGCLWGYRILLMNGRVRTAGGFRYTVTQEKLGPQEEFWIWCVCWCVHMYMCFCATRSAYMCIYMWGIYTPAWGNSRFTVVSMPLVLFLINVLSSVRTTVNLLLPHPLSLQVFFCTQQVIYVYIYTVYIYMCVYAVLFFKWMWMLL